MDGIRGFLFCINHVYFLIHIVGLKAIPWQRAMEETDEGIAQGFQINLVVSC